MKCHKNDFKTVLIKTEILVFLGIFYRFFNMLPWPDPKTTPYDDPWWFSNMVSSRQK